MTFAQWRNRPMKHFSECILVVKRRMTVEATWNVMAHAQKPDFVFWQNGRVHLNRRGASVVRGVRISGSNAGYTMFRGSVKGTGYPLRPPVSPSLPLPCITMCHHISTEVYPLLRSRVGPPTTLASFPFTSPPVRHRVPSHFNWSLPTA